MSHIPVTGGALDTCAILSTAIFYSLIYEYIYCESFHQSVKRSIYWHCDFNAIDGENFVRGHRIRRYSVGLRPVIPRFPPEPQLPFLTEPQPTPRHENTKTMDSSTTYQAPDYLVASTGLTAAQLETQFESVYLSNLYGESSNPLSY